MDEHQGEAHADPVIGTMIGRYRVEGLIGQGGMGAVYALLQPAIHKRLALKLLHREYAERKEIVRRFFDEARAVNLIGHPNIVDISDFSHLPDGRPFIIMEYLDGESLEEYLAANGKMDPEECLGILKQLCSALGAAHAKSIVHRDLKPENIFLIRLPDGALQVKVLDFGIAKLKDRPMGDSEADETQTGVVLGTPTYMSPEQAAGKTHNADHRTDIYSLGVMLFQMLSGQPPFRGRTFAELILKHIHHAPPSLTETRPDLPAAWGQLVARALAKDPEQRFQSMGALYDQAVTALRQPAGGIPAPRPAAATSPMPAPSILPARSEPVAATPTRVERPVPAAASSPAEPPNVATDEAPRDEPHDEPGPPPAGKARLALIAAPVVLVVALAAFSLVRSRAEDAGPEAEPSDGPALVSPVSSPALRSPAALAEVASDAGPSDAGPTDASRADARALPDASLPARTSSQQPAKKARGRGTLRVTANPWAQVFLDGKRIGQTPLQESIPTGAHRVRLKNDATGESRTHRFRLKKGEVEKIHETWAPQE